MFFIKTIYLTIQNNNVPTIHMYQYSGVSIKYIKRGQKLKSLKRELIEECHCHE